MPKSFSNLKFNTIIQESNNVVKNNQQKNSYYAVNSSKTINISEVKGNGQRGNVPYRGGERSDYEGAGEQIRGVQKAQFSDFGQTESEHRAAAKEILSKRQTQKQVVSLGKRTIAGKVQIDAINPQSYILGFLTEDEKNDILNSERYQDCPIMI